MALKDLVSTIAQALVDDPDGVEVDEIDGDRNCVIELRVAPPFAPDQLLTNDKLIDIVLHGVPRAWT
jgi:hypothetical protein